MNRGERRALWHYRLRGYRILGTNVRAGRNELDLIVRRGRELTFVEVKERRQRLRRRRRAVDAEKRRRVRRAAATWLAVHPEAAALEVRFEVAAVSGGRVERLEFADDDSRREWREPPFR